MLTIALVLAGAANAQAATFTVNSTNDVDDGSCDITHCSLREAINAANGQVGADVIAFGFTPGAVSTIVVGSLLPEITDALTIDGYSQSGSVANTNATGGLNAIPLVEIVNVGPTLAYGLRINANDVTIKGLIVAGDNFTAIDIRSGSTNVTIAGNFIGTTSDGLAAAVGGDNRRGVTARGQNINIGGSTPADRNLISGGFEGIRIQRSAAATAVAVKGNLIGTDVTGLLGVGNDTGILVSSGGQPDTITIGGGTAELGNVISGNISFGVAVIAGGTEDPPGTVIRIEQNLIGTSADGLAPLGNGKGVSFTGPMRAAARNNTVAHNLGAAITVDAADLTSYGGGVAISANRIYGNIGLGIDLGNDGRTANDAGDVDTGPNALLNFPVITSARYDAGTNQLIVDGTLDSAPNTLYSIELFISPNSNLNASTRDAKTLLSSEAVTTDINGHAQFTVPIGGTFVLDDEISATVTHVDGYTSEISDAVSIAPVGWTISGHVTLSGGTPVPFVTIELEDLGGTHVGTTTTDADGAYAFTGVPGGQDYAVIPSMANVTFFPPIQGTHLTHDVTFDFGAEPISQTYTVNTTDDADDGTCDAAHCSLREAIEIADVHPGYDVIAFNIAPAGVVHTINNNGFLPILTGSVLVDGYTQPGASPNTNATGGLNSVVQISLRPGFGANSDTFGLVAEGPDVQIRGLSIGGYQVGVIGGLSASAVGVTITGSFLGVEPDGVTATPDSQAGVIAGNLAKMTVGGSTPAERNLVSGNIQIGVGATQGNGYASTVAIKGNLIGTDITGQQPLGNGAGLVHQVSSGAIVDDHLSIGGASANERNVISGNLSAGIVSTRSSDADTADTTREIANNYVGVAADGVTPMGNMSPGIYIDGPMAYRIHDNVVANNIAAGIVLLGAGAADGRGFELRQNRIYANTGIAIDLNDDGRTANDADDSDTGVNGLQNFPVLLTAQETTPGQTMTVTGELRGLPNHGYTIELFTASSVNANGEEARDFLTTTMATTDASGVASFSTSLALTAPGVYIVATATEPDNGMTSEVSPGVSVTLIPRYEISGTITKDGAAPLAGVIVTLSGADTAVTATDATGHYAFTNLVGAGPYVITPSLAPYIFAPASAQLAALTSDTLANFDASVPAPPETTQYLAEGATGSFWHTTIGVMNPSGTATTATLDFLLDNGVTKTLTVPLTAPGHVTIDPSKVAGLEQGTFSTVVRSTAPIVAGRTMRWGNDGELGAHAEQSVPAPRDTWYFAEGATGCFKLFYLLVNPGATAADVTITYTRRAPETPIVLTYTVPAYSRYTVPVNDQPGLKFAEVAAKIAVTNHVPIVAERSMYSSCYGASWRGGHDSVGNPAPSTTWYLAEGATGSFFDFYLLAANFESDDATIEVRYLLADGTSFTKPHTVPAHSRLTIDVAGEDARLASTSVGAVVTSTNAVPVVVERSQWWPHGHWYEGHASAGATQAGIEWHLADAEAGGARKSRAYLLIANTSATAGLAQVRLVFDDGTVADLPAPVSLAGYERKTLDLGEVFPAALGKRFGVIVESFGATPAPIVVELSIYNSTTLNGADVFWGNGTNIVATRVR